MVKNYLYILFLAALLLVPELLFSQEPKVFTWADFDLNGKVKSCTVITGYGKEEFEFNEDGFLTKSVTRYNEHDYDITYYKYQGHELKERRDESYRDGEFDRNTSIAHLYDLDTTRNKKITEKILSYNQEFLDQYEYQYDIDGKLVKIIRSNNDGLDETDVTYGEYKGETTISYVMNGVIWKSIRTSFKKEDGSQAKTVLTKEFLEETPNKALEQSYDSREKLISEQEFAYNAAKKSFVPTKKMSYQYNEKGMLFRINTKTEEQEESQEYIYQFDGTEDGNWIKQIITPQNAYTTRKIEYFEVVAAKEEE